MKLKVIVMHKGNIKLLLILLITVWFTDSNYAQEDAISKFTLDEIVSYSMENNTSILNAHLDILASKKKVWETTAIGLPQVSAKVAYQNIFSVPEMNFGPYIDWQNIGSTVDGNAPLTPNIIYDNFKDGEPIALGVQQNVTADLTLSQLLFNGSYIVGLQASKTYKMLSEQSLQKTEQDVKELVTNSFYLCLVLDENLNNLNDIIENQKKTQVEIKALYQAGFVEESDADQIDLVLNNLKTAKLSLNRQVDLSYLLLKFQIGIPIENDLILNGSLNEIIKDLDFSTVDVETFAPEKNIDFKLLSTQERLSLLNLKNIKAEFLPSIVLFYNHQEIMDAPKEFNFASPNVLGINLEIPIFSSGQRLSKVSQAGIELEKLRNSKDEAYDGLKISFLKQKSDYLSALDVFQNEKKNMTLAKKIYDKTFVKYQNGLAGSMDLTQSQSQFLNSQSNYYNSIYDVLSSKTGLLKLQGKL